MLKGTPLKTTIIIMMVFCIIIMLSGLTLTTFYPNNTTCVGGICSTNTEVALTPINQAKTFFSELFSVSEWPKRWFCGSWAGFHGWSYILADLITFISYFGIPIFLGLFLKRHKKEKLPYRNLLWLFSFFIFFCGLTHLFDAITFWYPMYRLLGLIKVMTASVSFVTLIVLTYESKELVNLKSPKQMQEIIDHQTTELRAVNEQLKIEINHRNEYEEQLRDTIHQNELLFKELNHRVKNNLQMVAGMVRVNAMVKGMPPSEIADRVETRIKNMSLVHELLLKGKSVENVVLHAYLGELVETSMKVMNNPNIKIETQIERPLIVNTEVAINLGLITSEAITNSLKYAFGDNESGLIKIKAKRLNGIIELEVSDNGEGFDPKKEKRAGSLGSSLMESFTKNLQGGKLSISSDTSGTKVKVTFSG
ncbi:sensor histidine kinase [Ekhidna sp.]|uniref:sensor histidine kinase n=1 Tax=Ekhidna sp. TaxID=2608089 RepID=UPI003B59D57B